jgi:hypothetical protein
MTSQIMMTGSIPLTVSAFGANPASHFGVRCGLNAETVLFNAKTSAMGRPKSNNVAPKGLASGRKRSVTESDGAEAPRDLTPPG